MPPGPVQIVTPEPNNKVMDRRALAHASNVAKLMSVISHFWLYTGLLLMRNAIKRLSCKVTVLLEDLR